MENLISFAFSKDTDELRAKRYNIEIMIYDKADKVIK